MHVCARRGDAVLSGLRGEHAGELAPATAADLVEAAWMVRHRDRLAAIGVEGTEVALFLSVCGHRRLTTRRLREAVSLDRYRRSEMPFHSKQ